MDDGADWYEEAADNDGCMIVIKKYRGFLTEESYDQLISLIEKNDIIEQRNFGYNKFAWFQRLQDSEYPDYCAEIYYLEQ